MPETFEFKLNRFELAVARGEHEHAATQLLQLLNAFDVFYGKFGDIGSLPSNDSTLTEAEDRLMARLAAAVAALFADKRFTLSDGGFQKFLVQHRWIVTLFAASAFSNADYVIDMLIPKGDDPSTPRVFSGSDLLKLTLLYGLESGIGMNPEALWAENPAVAISVAAAMLSSRICISSRAYEKREALIAWLPPRLDDVLLGDASFQALADAYMHCSYSMNPDKHAIKGAINRHSRRRMAALGCQDLPMAEPRARRDRPLIVVPCEWIHSTSAMYRCYAPSITSLRERFEVCAVLRDGNRDEVAERLFDRVFTFPGSAGTFAGAQAVLRTIGELAPDMVFFPSIGMWAVTMVVSAFRMAPIQFMCLGHPATSHSSNIDYAVLEEGYLGDADCFSERLLLLPNRSQPWVPSHNSDAVAPGIRRDTPAVRIAVAASTMKLNPVFLGMCRRIAERSAIPVEFHFFCGAAIGIAKRHVEKFVTRMVPGAIVYPETGYRPYIERFNRCDMFLSPFPFGNTNGIVDAVRQGIPGVCLDGREVHSHIDAELFRRLSMPAWLVAKTEEEYLAAALRLVAEHETRFEIAQHLVKVDPDAVLFEGDAHNFADALWWLHENHERIQASGEKVIRPPLVGRGKA